MGIIFRSLLLAVLTGLAGVPVCEQLQAQPTSSDLSYVVDSWGIEDGLPVNNVVKVLQLKEGYLWMATFDGLVRFDGIRFKVYQTYKYPDLPSNRLTNLMEASDGSLWIETEQGFLVSFKDDQFNHVRSQDGLSGDICLTMSKDSSGKLWFGTNKGISIYDDGALTPFKPNQISDAVNKIFVQENGAVWFHIRDSQKIYRYFNGNMEYIYPSIAEDDFKPMYEDETGTLWMGRGTDILSFKNDTLTPCCKTDEEATIITGIAKDGAGTLWISSLVNGFYRYDGNEFRHFEPSKEEFFSFLQPFYLDEENKLWMFSRKSVWYQRKKILTVEHGINDFTFDREGNLWVATKSEGLLRLKPNPFRSYSSEDGLPGEIIYPVLEARDGTIWVGTHGGGVATINNGVVEQVFPFENTSSAYVQSLVELTDGRILAGLYGGLYEWRQGNTHFRRMEMPDALGSSAIYALYEQEENDLWVGSNAGLFRKRNGIWKNYSKGSGFSAFSVRFFLKAPDGSLLMATNGAGIVRYHNGKFALINDKAGFPSNLVRSLFIEPGSDLTNYVLWVGTEDQGLFRLQMINGIPQYNKVTHYGIADGMLDFVIHVILMDDKQNFWMNTNRGIFTVPKEELDAFHTGEINSIQGVSYKESNGLRNREGNGGMQPAGIRTSNGNIWLPGQGGVTVLDPENMTSNKVIPPVVIEELSIADSTFFNLEHNVVELAENQRDFQIGFSSLSFVDSEKNEFRYRLLGYNDKWLDAGGRRTVSYTNIPAGNYTFEVMGSNNAGVWNPEPAGMAISIAPYFYETSWFRIMMIGVIAFLIYGGVRLRIRSLEQNELKLKKLVKKRTHQLESEKEKTEAQAEKLKALDRAKTRFFTNISHEFRTPLTLIISPLQRMLSSNKEMDKTDREKELNRMLRNSSRLLRLIDQTLELTRLERGKLKLHVQQVDLCQFTEELIDLFTPLCDEKEQSLSIDCDHITEPIFADSDKLDQIIANLLSNAVKFTPLGGEISVNLREEENAVGLSVRDSGIGISKENQEKIFDRFYQADSSETRLHEGSGIGLSLAFELARLHHGDLTVHSTPGSGTTFSLTLKKGKAHFKDEEFETGDMDVALNHDEVEVPNVYQSENDSAPLKDLTTVLIVEDNDDMRTFIREVLEDTYTIIESSNGVEALKTVADQLPDLIIADIMMPKMDGITFNRELKENSGTASVPVIFLTAKTTKENQLEGLQEGADDYITKPFDPAILEARVNNLIESRFRLRKLLTEENTNKPSEESDKTPKSPFLLKIDKILNQHFTDPDFNVAKLAEKMYLERRQLQRKLKDEAELSPGEAIKKYRMEQASKLLIEDAGTISEVAYAVGFNSLAYFSFSFKEHYDISPSEYLQKENEDTTG